MKYALDEIGDGHVRLLIIRTTALLQIIRKDIADVLHSVFERGDHLTPQAVQIR